MSNRRLQSYPPTTPSFFLVTTRSEFVKECHYKNLNSFAPFPPIKLFCRWETFLPCLFFSRNPPHKVTDLRELFHNSTHRASCLTFSF